MLVFQRVKLFERHAGPSRLQQLGRAKKAANVIGAIRRRAAIISFPLLFFGPWLTLERIMSRCGLDRDPAQVGEFSDRGLASEAAIAAVFHPTEWHLRLVVDRRAVDMAHSRIDLRGHPQASSGVAGKDCRRKAKRGIIRDPDGLVFVRRANMATTGPNDSSEYSFISGVTWSRIVGCITAPSIWPPNASFAPFLTASATSAPMRSSGLTADDRAQGHIVAARIAGHQASRSCHKFLHEGVADLFIHNDAFGGHTNLPLVHECAKIRSGRGGIEVGVVEYEERRFAAQLQQRGLEMLRRDLSDDAPHRRRTGKVDAAHGGSSRSAARQ